MSAHEPSMEQGFKMGGRVVVTGSLAFDYIMDFPGRFSDHILPDKIHILNLSFTVGTLKKQYGGTAGNIAYNLALLGEKPTILGAAGSDFSEYRRHLERAGADTSKVVIHKSLLTSNFFVITDLADNQIGGFYPGPMDKALKFSLSTLGQKPFLAIVAPNNPQTMISLVLELRRLKIPFIFDPAQQIIRFGKRELLSGIRGAKVLIGNDYEIELIQEKTGLGKKKLLGLAEILVTTHGEEGSIIESVGKTWKIPPARPKKVVDPTGAGDAYRAGLIKGILENWPWEKTGKTASLAAVYAIEKYGTQKHRYTLREFKKRYKENFGLAF